MNVQDEILQHPPLVQSAHWSLANRVFLRLCIVYFTLFCLTNQIFGALLPVPNIEIPDPSTLWPIQQITFWVASHVFHAKLPLVYTGSGSGDKTFDWVLSFWFLLLASLLTCLWSFLDRKRNNNLTLHKWFRVFIRFALASQMLVYGVVKAIPLQMPFPYLTRLLEPYGNFSPMGVLWSSVGASPSYEIFTGCAEVLGGLLLIVPRTTTLGALICLTDMTLVFALNMTYDVPVKLFSFHMILLSCFLIAPEFQRLLDFFLWNRSVAPSTQPPLFASRRANSLALAAQIVFGVALLSANVYSGWTAWHKYGGSRPKSPLYGIWNVEQLSISGQLRSPLLTDYDRFHYAVFDFPERVTFQRMNGSFASYDAVINTKDRTLSLTKGSDKKWKANFTYQRPQVDQLLLDGTMNNQPIHMQLNLVDHHKFLLVQRGFHWIQEYPFNR